MFVHLFLACQLALPVSYYACRSDKNDERFAWRMFSPVRMRDCRAGFSIGEKRRSVQLGSVFHEAWLALARRGRRGVVTAMARELCSRNPGDAVRVVLICTDIDGTRKQHGGSWNLCEVDEL